MKKISIKIKAEDLKKKLNLKNGVDGAVGPKGDKGDSIMGKPGIAGPIGQTGATGLPGTSGEAGKDGSPDDRNTIVEKINSGLDKDLKISADQIDGLPTGRVFFGGLSRATADTLYKPIGYTPDLSAYLTKDQTTPQTITNQPIVTAVDADYVWINDTSDGGKLKKALKTDFIGGSQTPWTSNINGAGYSLSNISELLVGTTTGPVTDTVNFVIWHTVHPLVVAGSVTGTYTDSNTLTTETFHDNGAGVLVSDYDGHTVTRFVYATGYNDNPFSETVLTVTYTYQAGAVLTPAHLLFPNLLFQSENVGTANSVLSIISGGTPIFAVNGDGSAQFSNQLASIDVAGNIFATSFEKSGGFSTEFLKADGSVDSTTYLTASTTPLTITKTGAFFDNFPIYFEAPRPVYVGGSIITSLGKWINSFVYTDIVNSGSLTALSFDDLVGVVGVLTIGSSNAMVTLAFPALKHVIGAISLSGMAALNSLNLSGLISTGAGVTIQGNYGAGFTSLDLHSLQAVGATLSIFGITAITSIDLSALTDVGNGLSLTGDTALLAVSLPNLKNVLGNISFLTSNALTSISMPALVHLGASLTGASTTTLTSLVFGTAGILKHVGSGGPAFAGCALNQTSVDRMLAVMVTLDGTNGTTKFAGTINMSGGTSLAPTFTGATGTKAGSAFVGVTTTCTVTWVAHGFSTGDMITVTGITTLTNANRTAVITVDTPDQFHYTIVTQTATGAGTATYKLEPSASTEGYANKQRLVIQGATVTTN
jgi:hypothetical protein